MPPAPWWAFLVPVVIDGIKSLVNGATDSAKEKHREDAERRRKDRAARQKQKMTEYKIPHWDDFKPKEES